MQQKCKQLCYWNSGKQQIDTSTNFLSFIIISLSAYIVQLLCKSLNFIPLSLIIRAEAVIRSLGERVNELINHTLGILMTFQFQTPLLHESLLLKDIRIHLWDVLLLTVLAAGSLTPWVVVIQVGIRRCPIGSIVSCWSLYF